MIDQGLGEEWPEEVVAAIKLFAQGDLVERPPFYYVGSARYGVWQFTREVGDAALADELFELDSESCPPYGMITTETCDLTEEDAIQPRQPWLSVAPVYDVAGLLNEDRLDLLESGRIGYLRKLSSGQLPSGVWVVDVRIEFPVEKGWLVGRDPIVCCQGPDDRASIAAFLAGRRDRPVVSGDLYSALIKHMRRWIEGLAASRRAEVMAGIAEVRLSIAGSPLDPDGVGLTIVGDTSEIQPATREFWDQKWETWKTRLDKVQISLISNSYRTYDTMTAREYRDSFVIPLEF